MRSLCSLIWRVIPAFLHMHHSRHAQPLASAIAQLGRVGFVRRMPPQRPARMELEVNERALLPYSEVVGWLWFNSSELREGMVLSFEYGTDGYSRVELCTLDAAFIDTWKLRPLLPQLTMP